MYAVHIWKLEGLDVAQGRIVLQSDLDPIADLIELEQISSMCLLVLLAYQLMQLNMKTWDLDFPAPLSKSKGDQIVAHLLTHDCQMLENQASVQWT